MENLTFGIEIEYRNLLRDKVTKYLKKYYPNWESKKEDAIIKTSGNYLIGGEIVSPILHDTKESWQVINEICNFLISNNACSLNTGAHIHIGANIFENNSKYFLRFIKLWCAYEHIIYRFSYGEYIYARDTLFEYSSPVSEELKFLINTLKLSYLDNFSYLITVLNLGKKRGLNLSNINKDKNKNTIEFRSPNGTFNSLVWHNNFTLFKRMIEYAKSPDYAEEIIDAKLIAFHDIESNQIFLEDALELANLSKRKRKITIFKAIFKRKRRNKRLCFI